MYYGDSGSSIPTTPTITATTTSFGSDKQTENINTAQGKLVFTTPTTPPVTGNAYTDANIGPITVTEETSSGTLTTVPETINLSSSSSGTYIFSTTQGATSPTGNSSVSIPSGQSSVTFYYGDTKSGSWTIIAAATGLTSATEPVNINVGPLASFALSNPGTPTAGMPFNETITALDAGGNTVTSFGGTGGQAECLTFTGPHNSPNGTAPTYPGIGGCPSGSSVTFTNGVGTARITLSDAETTSLRATAAFITGVWTGFTVNPAGASAFALATPSPGAGIGFSETVTATDAYGNTATSYGGTGGLAECLTFTGPHNSPNGTAPTYPREGCLRVRILGQIHQWDRRGDDDALRRPDHDADRHDHHHANPHRYVIVVRCGDGSPQHAHRRQPRNADRRATVQRLDHWFGCVRQRARGCDCPGV